MQEKEYSRLILESGSSKKGRGKGGSNGVYFVITAWGSRQRPSS